MKIGIIGNGFVGKATQVFAKNYFAKDENDKTDRSEILPHTVTTPAKPAELSTTGGSGWAPPFFKRLLFKPIEVYIYDIRPEACQPPGMTLEQLDSECDIVFLCLPTPLNHDGSCYTKILEDTIQKCSNPYKVIRSTIPVGFAAKHGCYFMPEFLTEANWESDFRRTKEWVVGIPTKSQMMVAHGPIINEENDKLVAQNLSDIQHNEFKRRITKLIKRSYKNSSIDSRSIVFCDTNEAEMLKLMKNCFLSAKVGIMNEMYDFCNVTQTDYNTVTHLAKQDTRMGTSHFQVPGPDGRRGFGGTCFPKDTHSLYCQMNAHGLHPQIYPAILARNDTIDRPEREWSRDIWRTTIPLPTPESKVIVVFSDTSTVPSSESMYLSGIICTNLAKNNVVIEVTRSLHGSSANPRSVVSTMNHPNHYIKKQSTIDSPLFFPQVDECYYIPHSKNIKYDTMREVSCVIDLWNNHKEMTLYVIRQHHSITHEENHMDRNTAQDEESDTEGFDSDTEARLDTKIRACSSDDWLDYAKIIEEYYHAKFDDTDRRLVIMF